ncbi:MAG: 6-bladed beta-propeller [Verrucomicrobiales bacterium]|nr:6-bladed beta-propeller [Verrucomicrobiales bacterium]
MNWPLLQNSLLVSIGTTLASLLFGFVSALSLASLPRRSRQVTMALAVAALALPPFLVTNCWLHLLGEAGVWRTWIPFSILSLGGTVWILILLTWPITLLLVLGSWTTLEPAQLESDVALRGWPLLRFLLYPIARPALALAAGLTFVMAFNNFAVPAILQTKVFPAELWVSFNTTFNYFEAIKLSWPLLAVLLALLLLSPRTFVWPRLEGTVSPRLLRRQLGPVWFWLSSAVAGFLLLLSVFLPLAEIITASRTWIELPGALAAGGAAFWNSLLLAASAAFLCGFVSLFAWKFPLGRSFWMPFLAPGVLVGIALIFLFNRPATSALYQSFGIVVVGFGIRYFALSWTGARDAIQSVDPDLTSFAQLNGASAWQLLRQVYWPQIAPRMAAAWYITYLLCLWDVETLVLIAPPGGETLSLRVFNLLHYGHNTQVNALCLILLGLAVAPMAVWRLRKMIPQFSRGSTGLAWTTNLGMGLVVCAAGAGCGSRPANEAPIHSALFSKVQIIGSWGTALGQLNKPRSVAVDAADNLYVVDMTGRVQKFSPEGTYLAYWQMPQTDLGKPKGLCRDSAGNVIVLEPHYQRVNHFTPEGKLVAQWGTQGTNAGQLTLPRAVAVNSRGEIFISEYTTVDRVQQFSKDGGQFINVFGRPGTHAGEFNRAEGLGIDATDHIYVADSCNHRIQVFSPAGKFLRAYGRAGAGPGEMSYPYDVQIDAQGHQFVCEFGNSRVQIFDREGKSVEIIGRAGSAPGEFNNPWGLALDSKGNLYVADSRNHRVQRFVRKTPLAGAQPLARVVRTPLSPEEGQRTATPSSALPVSQEIVASRANSPIHPSPGQRPPSPHPMGRGQSENSPN